MSDSPLLCTLRARRTQAGLSQAELAGRVGVSRQALSAIEGGHQVPSTTLALLLARSLGCAVDDLFRLAAGPTVHATVAGDAPEGSRVVLGRVDGRWVAHPIHDDAHASDGAIAVASEQGPSRIELFGDPADLDATVLVAGCAPLLGVLAERLGRRYRDTRALRVPASSGRALALLARDEVHVAGIHLADGDDPEAHVRAAQRALPGQRAHLVNLARWRQGFVVAPGNPLGLASPADLARPGLRVVARDAGSGAQRLLERVLGRAGVAVPAPVRVATSHDEVAELIRWGVADVGVAIEASALARALDFVPLAEERFDLVVPDSYLDSGPVSRFLDLIDQRAFRAEAAGLPGYDLSIAGQASTVERGTP